jgi:PAS domain S-box-containing protein
LKPWRIALAYMVFSALALALFAVPIWDGWRVSVGTLRVFVPEEMQALPDLFRRQGAAAVAAAIRSRVDPSGKEVIVFAGPGKQVLAGTMRRWPTEIPDAPGTYGHVIDLGDGSLTRVVVSQVALPDGYQLVIGRQSAGLMSMEGRFWYGVAAAMTIVLALGTALAWLLARRAEGLRESEQRYERAMVASNAGLWEWDARKDKYYLSARHLELLGFPPDTVFAGREDFLRRVPFHPEDRERWKREIEQLFFSGGTHLAHELRVIAGDEIRWVHVNAVCFRDDERNVARLTGSVTDITERKLAEEASRASQERYSLAMEAAEEGHFDLNLDTDEVFISERLDEIHGFVPGTRLLKRSEYFKYIRFYGGDEEKYYATVRAAEAKGGPGLYEFEFRIQRPSGELRWLRIRGKVTRDAEGRARRRTGVVADITEAKQAVEALRISEERYSLALDASGEGHFDIDVATDNLYSSDRMLYEIFGYPPGLRFKTRPDFMKQFPFYGNDGELYRSVVERAMVKGGPDHYEFEFRIVRPSGEMRWLWTRATIKRDAEGNPVRRTGVCRDITEAKLAGDALRNSEEALRDSEERYALAVAGSDDGVWDIDFVNRHVFISARSRELMGMLPGPDMMSWQEWSTSLPLHPDDLARRNAAVQAHLAGKTPAYIGEFRIRQQDGTYRWRRLRGLCVRNADGQPTRMAGSITDIDDRKRAEEGLRHSEQGYELAMEAAQDAHWDWDMVTGQYYLSPRVHQIYGVPLGTKVASRADVLGLLPYSAEENDRWTRATAELFAGSGDRLSMEQPVIVRGETRWVQRNGVCVRDASGKPIRWSGSARDVTDRRRAENALRLSQERYALALEASEEGHFDIDAVTDDLFLSDKMYELFGYPPGTRFAKRQDFMQQYPFYGNDRDRYDAVVGPAMAKGGPDHYEFEFRIVWPSGEVRWLWTRAKITRDAEGNALRRTGMARDLTEAKLAEESLRKMELELRRAQRLEAIGTLAGGIAHDFNNILGAILGYGEMAQRGAAKGSRLARDLDSIMVAGERGRALVDRVLAFSRSAVGERVPVRVEEVVREALDLVSAKLPPKVKLNVRLRAGGAALLGDATQVHQVLTNLATNAIQAMPAGGTLRVSLEAARIEAARETTIGALAAADYLVLAVADTGGGIESETLERIFDPFFTTKEVGTGTGLGLSLVHGIVTDLGGAIDVATKVGKGTTFTVYLPRIGDAAAKVADEERPLPRGGGERVLVVDDEEPLVRLAVETLQSLGYTPIGFTSSVNALQEFGANPGRFDAILTDERMPGVTGTAIIREVRRVNPSIPILLMSGFVGGAAAKARELGANEVLKKPLLARELATSLARVLRP